VAPLLPERGGMYTANLRRVGISVMLAAPSIILEMSQMELVATVSMIVESWPLIIELGTRKMCSLHELLD